MPHTFLYAFHHHQNTPHPELDARHGKPCELLRALHYGSETDVPMYEIQFEDGLVAHAFLDEVQLNEGELK